MSKNEKASRRTSRRKDRNEPDTVEKAKAWAKSWLDAALWAFVVAIIIRTFFFEAYRIPTPSMEQTLLTGDFLIVSKMNYGPRTPMTIGVPFTSIHVPGVTLPWFRIPGFQNIKRNDIVVFNYPVDAVPISQRTNYIKRAVGMPGDELEIREKVLYINGEPAEYRDTYEQLYTVTMRERLRLSESKVRLAGGSLLGSETPGSFVVNMSPPVRREVETWPEVESIEPRMRPASAQDYVRNNFTFRRGMSGNQDHLPAFVIPYKGMELALDTETWPIYRDVVERHEGNTVQITDDGFLINGELTTNYIIQKDYYFMMGDNRDNSEDSRHWGFVPDNHVIGKPAILYFSWDHDRNLPRFNRLFSLIR
ncbi:MAG: signal peptidase I [Balneolales bacterium]|nr:signal peptidase I [Balneolales bacterium]